CGVKPFQARIEVANLGAQVAEPPELAGEEMTCHCVGLLEVRPPQLMRGVRLCGSLVACGRVRSASSGA
ncbi:MAG: hypothetical protein QOF95_1292, partial [Pseudonocardiales bacterium]|nr:hypothetical protein [Pseudonocardiales bacterium]